MGELVVIPKTELQEMIQSAIYSALNMQKQDKFTNQNKFTVAEAAEFTGRKISFLRSKIFKKEIKIIKEGKTVFVERRELVKWKR